MSDLICSFFVCLSDLIWLAGKNKQTCDDDTAADLDVLLVNDDSDDMMIMCQDHTFDYESLRYPPFKRYLEMTKRMI